MNREGPPLETLLRRLIDTPPDFLAEPRIGARGIVHVDAVVGDIVSQWGVRPAAQDLQPFAPKDADERNRLALALLACWLIADEWFNQGGMTPAAALEALDAACAELAMHATPQSVRNDPDRREEFVRTLLARLGLRPAGETPAQAQDCLVSVSGSERRRAVTAARGAAERARKIREALAKKAAEESADKMWRE